MTVNKKIDLLRSKLREGKVYRRQDLMQWTNSIDRHLAQLTDEGVLRKLARGIYYVPKPSVFGPVPPDEQEVIKAYLKGNDFLIVSPNYYNNLRLGTTQLYNQKWIYSHKKHGDVQLGNNTYNFRRKSKFPVNLSREYLLIDLLNNLKFLAEDEQMILDNLQKNIHTFDVANLRANAQQYGTRRTKKIVFRNRHNLQEPPFTPDLTILRNGLFWDTDITKIDWDRQYRAIIQRVFERGSAEEKKEITHFYGTDKISQALKESKARKPYTTYKPR